MSNEPVQLTPKAQALEDAENVRQSPSCRHYRINGYPEMVRLRASTAGRAVNPIFKETGRWICTVCTEIEEASEGVKERFDLPVRDAIEILEGLGYHKAASELKGALHG